MLEKQKKLIKLLSEAEVEEPMCRQIPDIFFPEDYAYNSNDRDNAVKLAKLYCMKCPLQQMCLDYAVTAKEEFGIWGGSTAAERNSLRTKLASLANNARKKRKQASA
jgi:WhiB family redox-sensing transcriptional regulator|tara:strand:+ start:6057 stop:6377 length:321 start_codon:yes stop_codon:yes gene_type:complete